MSFAYNVQVVFTNPTRTTKKCSVLPAIGPVKTLAHKPDRKVAWHATKDGLWILNSGATILTNV